MKPTNHTAPGAAAYSWISPEDIVRHALAAFYQLSRECDAFAATEGPDFIEPPAGFAADLAELFGQRLHHQGYTARLPGFHRDEYYLRRSASALPSARTNRDIH